MKWPLKWTGIKTETKASQGATRSFFIDSLANEFLSCSLAGEIITPQKALNIYRQNSSAATAVDMISDEFVKIKPVLELADGTFLDKSKVIDFLNNPNPYMGWAGFAERISRNYLLTRQNPMFALGVTSLPPQELYPVRPTYLSHTTGNNEYVQVYHVGSGMASGKYIEEQTADRIARYYDGPLKELYNIVGYSSQSTDATPDSPLQAAALETQQQLKGKVHNVEMLDNGGRMSMLIMFKDTGVDDDEMKRRLQRLNEQFGPGGDRHGGIGGFEGGEVQEVREMGKTQKDMDWASLLETSDRAIYFRYKIPLPMTTTDASSFNNLATAVEMLYDMAVLPHTDMQFSGLSRFLLPRFGIALNEARITYNPDSIKALKARRLNELEQRAKIGIETINELREAIPNRDDVEHGDVIYHNASQVPLGVDINDDGGGNE
jgi:phage portal protein BeeE